MSLFIQSLSFDDHLNELSSHMITADEQITNRSSILSQIYDYILDEEFSQEMDQLQTQEFKDKNKHKHLTLPIDQYRGSIMEAIHDYQVLIIQGEATSGKTTQLTQYLYEEMKSHDTENKTQGKMMIVCTQPHHTTTVSAATYVAEQMNVKLGDEVGYSTNFNNCTSDRTVIKYITDEMLLKELLIESNLQLYSVIIIDEAHERTVHTDILLGLMKDIIRWRPKLKLLISSASMESVKFSEFFDDAPIFAIPGRRFPVDIHYTQASATDYIHATVETVLQIHTTQPLGNILVFLTGQEDIDLAKEMLLERTRERASNIKELIFDMQASQPIPLDTRKVFLTTDIAVTFSDIDNIRYVIDPGFCKQKMYNSHNSDIESLMITAISKVSADQRASQAGRNGPGQCFRIYTAWTYQNEFNDTTMPEIQRMNLTRLILLLKNYGINDPLTFHYVDSPSVETLRLAFKQLYALGALNDKNELTNLGFRMAQLPLDPMVSKTLLASETYQCSEEILTIISMLSIQKSIFYQPKHLIISVNTIQKAFFSPAGDHLSLLNIYNQWKETNYSREWCDRNFIQYQSMNQARQIRQQLEYLIKRVNIKIESNPIDCIGIGKALCAGFFSHTAKLSANGIYKTICHQKNVHLHPDSCVMEQVSPYVIYFELIHTNQVYMKYVIPIEIEWLRETASDFYKMNKFDENDTD